MRYLYVIILSISSLYANAQSNAKQVADDKTKPPAISTFAQPGGDKFDKQAPAKIDLSAVPSSTSVRRDQKPFDANPGAVNNGQNVNIYSNESKLGNGNTKLKNDYMYDDQGRMIQSKSSFEFGKK